ncbi:nucleotide sugar dehydrogenase [Saccharothrix ecbatanensis]|uniref:Nucleotide sugar dehydrogenase n=1 Tax=Saccharothrix ecbatanensis TaxID=1105145 RepID=A0A7W9LXZ6_9PSEU|nr:UDP binding domain-containing protein [Saccharothrix ecbatanensis]MBB5800264.1 nucleotide sugar dehydrogenase [Saccharothrix ecbatanensis]
MPDRPNTQHGLADLIARRDAPIMVWGGGFIGLSAAVAFADVGFRCHVVDIDADRVVSINNARVPVPGFEDRIPLRRELVDDGRLSAGLPDEVPWPAAVHVVCVNTDRSGKPVVEPLLDVLRRIRALHGAGGEVIVSIESTVNVRWLREEVLPTLLGDAPDWPGLHLIAAPRRDWMLSADMNLKTLPRVVGSWRDESRPLAEALYSSVSEHVHVARDWAHAALTKPVENLYRYLDLVLTNQLTEAYPDLDVVEVLKLAGTKWNMPTYHPSIGIGGYCIPLSPEFIVEDVAQSQAMPIVHSAREWSAAYPRQLAAKLRDLADGPIGILGVSYAPDARISEGSPAAALARCLRELGVEVRVHDPYFTPDEATHLTGSAPLAYPTGLAEVRMLVVATAHAEYRDLPDIITKLSSPPLIVDNLGLFREELVSRGIQYFELGALSVK